VGKYYRIYVGKQNLKQNTKTDVQGILNIPKTKILDKRWAFLSICLHGGFKILIDEFY